MASAPGPPTLASLASLPGLSVALDGKVVGGFLVGVLLCSSVSLFLSSSASSAPASPLWDPYAPCYTDLYSDPNSDTHTAPGKRPFFDWATLLGATAPGTPRTRPFGETVCWSSAQHGGYGDPNASGAADAPSSDTATSSPFSDTRTSYSDTLSLSQGGVVVHGPGCRVCFAGSVCSFTISIRPPAHWLPSLSPQKWELMVHLYGPSLRVADIRQLPPIDGSRYIVSYLIWDPGRYRVVVRSSCNALNYTANFQAPEARLIAQWDATVYASALPPGTPTPQGPQAGWGRNGMGMGSREAASALSMMSAEAAMDVQAVRGEVATVDPRPCSSAGSLQGRWLRDQTGNYRYEL